MLCLECDVKFMPYVVKFTGLALRIFTYMSLLEITVILLTNDLKASEVYEIPTITNNVCKAKINFYLSSAHPGLEVKHSTKKRMTVKQVLVLSRTLLMMN